MKFKVQTSRLLTAIISYQMIIAPVAIAQDNTTTPTKNSDDKSFWEKAGGTASDVLQLGAGAFQAYQGAQGGGMVMTPELAALKDNVTPIQDKFFNPTLMGKIPGLAEYMAVMGKNPAMLNCSTLPAELNDIQSPVCDPAKAPANQSVDGLLTAYKTTYSDIQKTYKNYASESNAGGAGFGYSCMKNAQEILKGFFDYRAKEMDNLVSNIEALNQKFKNASKGDLDNIEESSALLNGGNSNVTNKVKTAKPALFDFAAQFNDPACKSMFAGDTFKTTGDGKGLLSIQDMVVKTTEAKPKSAAGSAKSFSGETFSKAYTSVVEDITNMATNISKQSTTQFSALVNGSDMSKLSTSSTYGVESAVRSSTVFTQAQQKFSEKNLKLQQQLAEVSAELGSTGVDPSSTANLVSNLNSGTFDTQVGRLQNSIENKCVSNSSQIDMVISKMVNPQVSSYGNKNVPSFIKDKLKQILTNDLSSTDKKLEELLALEKQGAGSYYVKLDASYEVQEVVNGELVKSVVSPTTRKTPTAYLTDIIRNCKAQFKSNTLESKYSGATAIAKLKELRSNYQALATETAADIKSQIMNKFVNCDSQIAANQDNTASCSAESFDMSSGNFCANSALSCSKNMQSCKAKAQKIVNDIKVKRQVSVTNYTANVEKNKKDLVAIFDTALTAFKAQGTQLGALFNLPWQSPTGIQREITDGSQFNKDLKAVDPSLLIEDPDKYVDLLKKNVALLKKNIEDQSKGINDALLKHVNDTKSRYDNNAKIAGAELAKCDATDKQIDQNIAKANEEQGKLNEAASGVCLPFSTGSLSGNGFCGAAEQVSEDSLKAAYKLGNTNAAGLISSIKAECSGNSEAEESAEEKAKTKFDETEGTLAYKGILCSSLLGTGNKSLNFTECNKLFPKESKQCPEVDDNKGTKQSYDYSEIVAANEDQVRTACEMGTLPLTTSGWAQKKAAYVAKEASGKEDTKLTQLGAKITTACSAQSNQQSNKVVDQLGQILGGTGGTGVNAIR
jgi:hypothetical protein